MQRDLFARFTPFLRAARDAEAIVRTQFRLTVDGPLDHHITVVDPSTGAPRSMICFDSNSYLGLHLDPRVVGAARRALDDVGFGTPSAQLLAGTNRHLRALEDVVADYHGREAALIFPSGYAANVGVLGALLRPADTVARDRFSHASVHDGCRFARVGAAGVYAHGDMADCARVLARGGSARGSAALIATDGVFSMHGTLAPLPELVRTAHAAGARLYVDEAHATGILGPRGRGLEDHFRMPGAIDVLVGTFSKAPGCMGGYVAGTRDLVDYLRFHARASVFTASLPAHVCAGVAEAYRRMAEDSAPRERLWANTARFASGARALGVVNRDATSPIVPITVGSDARLFAAATVLWERGIKCGAARFPAVPLGQAALRFSINARHTEEDIDRALDAIDAAIRAADRAGERSAA